MIREQIIAELKRFFDVRELVCPHTYAKWGERSWQFLDTDYLHALLVVRRDILKGAMTCNGGKYTQRGLRCNMCPEVRGKAAVYLSAHILGKAGDFTVSGMTAEQARQKIKAGAELLPCNVRLEGGVSWLHLDVLPQAGVTDKVYIFKA
ncbi:MAG: hypothetical protein IIW86_04075 [Clostridia bacterium]|nr:hypothetical protein [Clostridia bacterium]